MFIAQSSGPCNVRMANPNGKKTLVGGWTRQKVVGDEAGEMGRGPSLGDGTSSVPSTVLAWLLVLPPFTLVGAQVITAILCIGHGKQLAFYFKWDVKHVDSFEQEVTWSDWHLKGSWPSPWNTLLAPAHTHSTLGHCPFSLLWQLFLFYNL